MAYTVYLVARVADVTASRSYQEVMKKLFGPVLPSVLTYREWPFSVRLSLLSI